MDAIQNPYAPGAGAPPPELAGRDPVLDAVRVAVARHRKGRSSKGIILVGLRGVGKTVLLDRARADAEADGIAAVAIEASEQRSLPASLAPALHNTLLRLSRREAAADAAHRALRALAGFASALKVRYQDIEVGMDFDFEPEPGVADHGALDMDLTDLLEAVGRAAQSADTCVALFVDELQYVHEAELAALIAALHRTTQRQLPVALIGAGLPQVRGRLGKAKSYAERQFDLTEIGALSPEQARLAIVKPALEEGVEIEAAAIEAIVTRTQGYPYFLQEWGNHVWDVAAQSPITLADVEVASDRVIAELDQSFFGVRFDRLTPTEYHYVRAMAELGPGPHRSRDIAEALGREAPAVAPVRSRLIGKGMIWSPGYGDTAFTVPLFDEFMKRTMPDIE